jgi:SAM-dependent methyltransferase
MQFTKLIGLPTMTLVCPICQSTEFDDFAGRKNARCVKCGSLERGRFAWIIIERLGLMKAGVKVLNCAPEPFMLFFAAPVLGDSYIAADFYPEIFAKYKKEVRKLNLCGSMEDFADQNFDIIMHNHVLEHLPCDVSSVLIKLNKLLTPGGYHLFSAPILPNRYTEEDLDPNLSGEERKRRFGQDDHMRVFGDLDFMSVLDAAGMTDRLIDVAAFVSQDDLRKHGVPEESLLTLNGHRVFVYQAPK